MKIIYKKRYKDYEKKDSRTGGLVRIMTVQLIICALVFSAFLAIKKVNSELFEAVTTGKFGDVEDSLGKFEDYLGKLADESPVWSVLFGYPDKNEEQNKPDTEQKDETDELPTVDDEPESDENVLAVFGSTGLLYDTDLEPVEDGFEADEDGLSISLPKYSLVKYELPETPCYPLKTAFLTDTFGLRINPVTDKEDFHTGIDLGGVKKGTEAYAIMSGKVKKAGYDRISGNYVILEFENGFTCCYCHLNKAAVKTGDTIEKGQVIGYVGSTGQATGTHLHFHMKKDGAYLDPLNYFNYKPKNAD